MVAIEILSTLQQVQFFAFFKSGLLIIAGFLLARLSSNAASKFISRYAAAQQVVLIQKIVYFAILILFLVAGLQQLGFKLSVLLGSAGIATAAIAIASQTSISNIISGLFLIMEKSFKIGDKIQMGNTIGVITSIDLLSVKILTANNTLIRIPNETLIKSEITNITRFESRRLDLSIKIPIEVALNEMKALLLEIAQSNALSLKTPLPSVNIQKIEADGVDVQLSVWVDQKHYENLLDSLYEQIIIAFKGKPEYNRSLCARSSVG
jgi:small-conductance mechanosensitive channel